MRALCEASILGQSHSEQGFQKLSRTVQEHLTNSTKEFVRCNSDTLTEISHSCEAAIAPLAVASPQSVESVEELEEVLPTAMDCTTLALVDDVQGQSALLIGKSQDYGVEAIFPHEGTCSVASVAVNELSSSSAIAHQTQGQVEAGNRASLMAENSVSGVELAVDEGEGSAAPVTSVEKWSHKAIVARSNVRPERMQKLKVAANSGQNPNTVQLSLKVR
ncbi:hypothetical protein [Nostoc flagelliforme]|uniref:hypothetical protein n=1 Tax=Nostoc flagelliforme TaxID=1306274 RepID=UPI001F54BAAF|nr:hypothetical protein [Nostoc flagelliforme]